MHFCTYALNASIENHDLAEATLPRTGARVLHKHEIHLDDFWLTELGQAFAADCADATLNIDVAAKHQADAEDVAEKVYFALWLHGLLQVGNAVAVVGRIREDGVRVVDSPVPVVLPGYLKSRGTTWPTLDTRVLDSVDCVANGLRVRDRRQDEFRRLWHGIRALRRALTWDEQHDAYERGANLVRSVEAIVFEPGEHAGMKAFGHRVTRLCIGVPATTLSDAYELVRNAYVHMHPRYLPAPEQVTAERFDALNLLIEDLALFLWRQILGNPAVLESVSDANLPALREWLAGGKGAAWVGRKFLPPAVPREEDSPS
ncbi:MAG: hypothetical protein FJ100_17850 [Deltaproteobacteria bacterium]|nr:hypothetical protein [Deltaproteobacteria bacterium]